MYISLNWIKDYVNLDGIDPNELINKFTLSTAEVEGIEYKGKDISGIVVGQILSVENHPNSHKLHLLKVDVGSSTPLDIVCGAPNVRVGLKVAVALDGAQVGDVTIRPAKVAGFDSFGMCCGASELKISDDDTGLLELPDNFAVGQDIKKLLDIDDIIFEVDNKSLTNRPDLWGHYGIAREIAALTHRPLKPLNVYMGDYPKTPKVDVQVETDKCYRYMCCEMHNITTKQSPLNMQIRLFYTGMRSINLLADITNYIMLELGQPMHAFDNEKVKNIQVKQVKEITDFVTLDHQTRHLPTSTMVICSNNVPECVAGVMGGLNSEIEDDTNSVLIESANFDSAVVRKTAIALGLRSEASARYEKSLDPEMCSLALNRFVQLVLASDKGAVISSNVTDVYNYRYPRKSIDVSFDYITNFIGVKIPTKTIVQTLKDLDFGVTETENGLSIDVPTFRATKDINGKQDIIEEITRIYGYDNLPALSTTMQVKPVTLDKSVDEEYSVKYALASRYGMHEIHSYIWYNDESLKELNITPDSYLQVANAINKEGSKIRATMVPTMLNAISINRLNNSSFGIFEMGRVVSGVIKDNLADERKHLCIALYSKTAQEGSELLHLKEVVEYLFNYELKVEYKLVKATPNESYISPVNYYKIVVGGEDIGFVGALHPTVKTKIAAKSSIVFAELDFSIIANQTQNAVTFNHVSKYPVTALDFNLVIDKNMLYSEVEHIAKSIVSPLSFSFNLLDIFDNVEDNTKSYTLHFELTSFDHTLNSAEIETFHTLVIDTFGSHGIQLKK